MKEKLMKIAKDKQNWLIAALLLIIVGLVACILLAVNKEKEVETDSEKFAKEYTLVGEENLFVYRDIDEIIKILENGTGVVLLGFPECPWCQQYAVYLNEVAKDLDFEKIYYFNILNDRKDNTEKYQEIVSLIGEHLQYDDEGNKRVYVPAVIAVNKGEIVGFDDETAWDTKGFEKPEEYWNDEEVTDLKTKLETMFNAANPNMCTSCNEK